VWEAWQNAILHLLRYISETRQDRAIVTIVKVIEIIPFDRAYMTSHSLSIVTMALSRLVYEIWHFSTPRLLYGAACRELLEIPQ